MNLTNIPLASSSPAASFSAAPYFTPADAARIHKNFPAELQPLLQFVGWKFEPQKKGDKPRKIPYAPNFSFRASCKLSRTWGRLENAIVHAILEAKRNPGQKLGVGFEFAGGYFGIDLDNCIGPAGMSPDAQAIIDRFPGYWEVSDSGRGVKGIFRGQLPTKKTGHSKDVVWANGQAGKIEMYHSGRYFAFTGRILPGCRSEIVDHGAEGGRMLLELHPDLAEAAKAPRQARPPAAPASHKEGCECGCRRRHAPLESDAAIIRRLSTARSSRRLWDGSQRINPSVGDFALCKEIARLTGPDFAAVERIFDQSARSKREKWGRPDFRQVTIENAFADLQKEAPAAEPAAARTNCSNFPEWLDRPICTRPILRCRRIGIGLRKKSAPSQKRITKVECGSRNCKICGPALQSAYLKWFSEIIEQWEAIYMAVVADGKPQVALAQRIERAAAKDPRLLWIRIPLLGDRSLYLVSGEISGTESASPEAAFDALNDGIFGLPAKRRISCSKTAGRDIRFRWEKDEEEAGKPKDEWERDPEFERAPLSRVAVTPAKIVAALRELGIATKIKDGGSTGCENKTYIDFTCPPGFDYDRLCDLLEPGWRREIGGIMDRTPGERQMIVLTGQRRE